VGIIAGSAFLAFLGDMLGSKYGKQRISILGLRPKYTSRLITAFTGIFISVVVLTVVAFFSQNVRALIFSIKFLQRQSSQLRTELQATREELSKNQDELLSSRVLLDTQTVLLDTTSISLDIARLELERSRNDRDLLLDEKEHLEAAVETLRSESEELKRELEAVRLEAIAVQANALLAQTAVPPGTPEEEVVKILDSLKERVHLEIFQKLSERWGPMTDNVKVKFDAKEESDFIARVSNAGRRFYLRALAAENITMGEAVGVRLEYGRSNLLYDREERIYRKLVDPEEPGFNAEETLHVFLRELRYRAVRAGVLIDPATNSVGALEGEDFFDVVEKMKLRKTPTIINAIALEDIYTEGPVRIKIELE
jgi:uncharacterized protein (DUF3084 family)